MAMEILKKVWLEKGRLIESTPSNPNLFNPKN